ncbi:MAG: hypothetical protein COA43_03570 [Robiginitomaculum sp.]|nr:MAG: hypothetical protein COA43_03570 [Robiginitomaculum sp.]
MAWGVRYYISMLRQTTMITRLVALQSGIFPFDLETNLLAHQTMYRHPFALLFLFTQYGSIS